MHSKNIVCIFLENCNIDDSGLYCLFETLRHRSVWMCTIDIDCNPRITTLGLKKCLSMLLTYPNLSNLLLSTKSLLNEENKRIIEKVNYIRRIHDLPPLYVGDGLYRRIGDKLTNIEKENINFATDNKELAIEGLQRVIYNSRNHAAH